MQIDNKTTAVGFAKQTAETMQKMADAIQVLSKKIIENSNQINELENRISHIRNTTDHDFISVESRIDELEEKNPTLFDK
jgi:predicted  nucleic acid-binding Zn-ribbon protein